MAKLTRRGLLKSTAVGVAAVGVLGAGLAAGSHLAAVAAPADLSTSTPSEPVAAYVRNSATGELGILVGTREVIVHDSELVTRLLNATR